MPPRLALLLVLLFIAFALFTERKRNLKQLFTIFIVFLWGLVASTRPVGVWIELWGFPVVGSSDPTTGSIYDRLFYGPVTFIGLIILFYRKTDWGTLARKNTFWLFLFTFMALSIIWSSFPMVSIKRLIKSLGSVVMALLVLTSWDRKAATSAIIRWCAYIHVPLSIITIKYFRYIGVTWNDFSGEASWVGLATSKNTLGQVAAISTLYFLWDWKSNSGNKLLQLISFLYIVMGLYLLKGADESVSVTSVSVFGIGFILFVGLKFFKNNPLSTKRLQLIAMTAIFVILVFLTIHANVHFSKDSLLGRLVTLLGRDLTLTGRTEIWQDIFQVASRSPFIGVGFGAFWIGRLANIPWTENLSWTLGQGHNGYIDTYLQLGWIGLTLLIAAIIYSARSIRFMMVQEGDFGRLRTIFFLIILFINITETTFFRGDHYLWLIFLLVALTVPYKNNNLINVPSSRLNTFPK